MELKSLDEMLKEAQDIEAGIYSAIGSQGKLKSMLGAKDFVRTAKGLKFSLARQAKDKINTILIELNSKDTYDITLANFSIKNGWKEIHKDTDIQGEYLKSIIEMKTGLHLSL